MFRLAVIFAISAVVASAPSANEFSLGESSFASDFYQQCIKSVSGNLIVSPYSVVSALALLSQGANGNSFEQLKRGMHLNVDKAGIANQYSAYNDNLRKGAGKSTLSIANQLYVQQGIELNANFRDVAVQKFKSGVDQVDFNKGADAARTINQFVEEKTQNKITDLVKADSFDGSTRVVLINAIYMKAKWLSEFQTYNTYEEKFYTNGVDKVSVDFMHATKQFNYGALPDLDAAALEMNYIDSDFSFLVILPNNRLGLSALETKLKDNDVFAIKSQMNEQLVKVSMPKFKIESELMLKDALKNMGISEIFEKGKADLSGLLKSSEPQSVSGVIHKAFIEINEEGTEAAAATGLFLVGSSMQIFPRETPVFKADHPFVYYVIDNETNTIIFNGRVMELK